MAHSGQMCTAIGRVVVHSSSYDQVRDALAVKMRALTVGHALDESANLGPLINEAAADRYISYVDAAGHQTSILNYEIFHSILSFLYKFNICRDKT